jgi:lipoprotein-releasing system permease protein
MAVKHPIGWVLFTARHFIRRNRQSGRARAAGVFSVLGIATGVLALTVIIAVMNGFQLGFIESILEISSYHVRVDALPASEAPDVAASVLEIAGTTACTPFLESRAMLRSIFSNPIGAVIRGLPADALSLDPGLAAHLEITAGAFDIENAGQVVLGAELARRLGARVGDTVICVSIAGFMPTGGGENERLLTVSGIFRCGYYEYDSGWAFMNIAEVASMNGAEGADGEGAVSLGIKIKNRFNDAFIAEKVRAIVKAPAVVSSWRDYNKSFFSALRTEKMFMFVLVGLIFIVVGVNIYQSQRRLALEKREEIGLLRALGARALDVRLVFVCNGLYIGLAGAASGMALGLALALNMRTFFGALEFLFPATIFYLKEIPSRVIPHEAALIFLFGFLSAVVSAALASRRATLAKPAEVLRQE